MFGKGNKQAPLNGDATHATIQFDLAEEQNISPKADSCKRNTIIAKDTIIRGNVEVDGDIQLYGEVIGNINIQQGSIRVMDAGHVNGELTAPTIIIDGRVDGICYAKTINILENGELQGISRCESFSIKPGGTFIGQSEKIDEKGKESGKIAKFNSFSELGKTKEVVINDPVELLSGPPMQTNKK